MKNKYNIKSKRLYNIWRRMKQRCNDKNTKDYKWYGMKGIKISDEFMEFMKFQEWALKNGYDDNLTIDRIDSSRDYTKENCQWITRKENAIKSTINAKISKGENHYRHVLNNSMVFRIRKIKEIVERGYFLKLSRATGISVGAIQCVIHDRTWKEI